MKKILGKIIKKLILFLPVSRSIIFRSFSGDFNDNPYYIYMELQKLKKNYKIIWTYDKRENIKKFPDEVKLVKFGSISYWYFYLNSRVVIDNYWGLNEYDFFKRDVRKLEKRNQFRLATWHGTPLKKIGKDMPNGKKWMFKSLATYFVSNSAYFSKNMKSAFGDSIIFKDYGSPRNDLLLKYDSAYFKRILGIDMKYKVVLFAPTFRNSVDSSISIIQSFSPLKVLDVLTSVTGDEWLFVYRVHNELLNIVSPIQFNDSRILNGNLFPDMNHYLGACDLLITDYSGSIFDAAVCDKKIVLYVPDLENYSTKERGFYMDFNLIPYPKALDDKSLYDILKDKNVNFSYCNKKMNSLVECFDEGIASSQAVKDIVDWIENYG